MKLPKEQIKEWLEPNERTKARWKEMDRQREEARHKMALEEYQRERDRIHRRNLIRDLFGI